MRQFKLIKLYPEHFLPLNAIITFPDRVVNLEIGHARETTYWYISLEEVLKFPEFWEEVKW